jgi:hypothetical protein
MAKSAKRTRQDTYLVEHYAPGCGVQELQARVARVRDAVSDLQGDHPQLALVRWTIVPHDESILCLVEAASEQLVRDACACAAFAVDRISVAIAGDADEFKSQRGE